MPEKKLQLEFTVAGGGTTTMTLSDVQQNLDATTIGGAMTAMCSANCFADSDGAAYSAPMSANYVETTTTNLFDNGDSRDDNDYPAS